MNVTTALRKPLLFLGIDRAIAYTLVGRGWSVIAGPVTLIFIANYLSPEEQGFYYTFGSIISLNIFFELGLSYVVLQFASHEKAKLEWGNTGTLVGDATAKARLSALLRMALLWYGVVALLVVAVILPAGFAFFSRHQSASGGEVGWQLPWVLVVVLAASYLCITPLLAVIEGCGLVAEIAIMRVYQAVASNFLLWLALSQGLKLYALPMVSVAGLSCAVGWLMWWKRSFLLDLLSYKSGPATISWWGEVWPFQWKIALSWLSGYFIFQLFNPVLFAYHGPVVAGQMGMSLSLTTALSTTAMAWVQTKAPAFGSLIAQKEFKRLDQLFARSLWQSFAMIVLAGATLWSLVFYLQSIGHPWGGRLLSPWPLGFLIATAIVNHIVFAEAVYLRAHKQEPFLFMSVLGAFTTGGLVYILGRYFGVAILVAGYFVNTFIGLWVTLWIFSRKRRLWHEGT